MLSGPTLLRVVLTLVVAALLAALWQMLPPLTRPGPATPAKSVQGEPAPPPASPPAPASAAATARIPPPPAPPPAPVAIPQPSTPQAPSQSPTASAAALAPAPPPSAPAAKTPAAAANASSGATAPRAEPVAAADDRPASGEPLDLNTAGVQELNRLRGGGLIGRSIVRGRPYKSVDELLTKRVLSRSAYERIRDQVTVH